MHVCDAIIRAEAGEHGACTVIKSPQTHHITKILNTHTADILLHIFEGGLMFSSVQVIASLQTIGSRAMLHLTVHNNSFCVVGMM